MILNNDVEKILISEEAIEETVKRISAKIDDIAALKADTLARVLLNK